MTLARARWTGGLAAGLAIGLAVAIAACHSARKDAVDRLFGDDFVAEVVAVADGDTLTVGQLGLRGVLRLASVDAPELDQPFGPEARRYATEQALGKLVRVVVVEIDAYDRLVAEVLLPDGRSLNGELVRLGLAWYNGHFQENRGYAALQRAARALRAGLWSQAEPEEPWRHRFGRWQPWTETPEEKLD